MKKLVSLLLVLTLCLGLLPMAARAEVTAGGSCGASADNIDIGDGGVATDSVKWKLENGTLTISGKGEMADYYDETYLPWHEYAESIKKIVVGEGVTVIGGFAFFDCENVTEVSLPESLTEIESYAFSSCHALKSITIPKNVTKIGWNMAGNPLREGNFPSYVFPNGCLAEIKVAKENTTFESIDGVLFETNNATYSGKTLLFYPPAKTGTSYTVPSNVQTIAYDSINADEIVTLTIPESVTKIEESAITSNTLAAFIVEEGNKNYSTADGVLFETKSGEKTLLFYPSRKKDSTYTVPSDVKKLADHAIQSNPYLTEVTVSEGVTEFGMCNFSGMEHLKKITLPATLQKTGYNSFTVCPALETFVVAEKNPNYTTDGGVLFNKDKTTLVHFPDARTGTYEIPNGVTRIEHFAFQNSSLTSVKVPEGVDILGMNAFFNSRKLVSVSLPKSITKTHPDVFFDCTKLENVYYYGTEADFNEIKKHYRVDTNNEPEVGKSDTQTVLSYMGLESDSESNNEINPNVQVRYDFDGKVTVTLDAGNATFTGDTEITTDYNTPATAPATNPTHAGMAFAGWYYNGTRWDWDDPVYTDMILTARWNTVYYPTAEETPGGTTSVITPAATSGDTVTVRPQPDSGYVIDTITVTDEAGNKLEISRNNDGSFDFTQPSTTVTIEVTYKEQPKFVDVKDGDWFHDAVDYAVLVGMMSGTSSTTFEPNEPMTRAMFATVLWNYAGKPTGFTANFKDVKQGDWFYNAVAWASSKNVISGMGNGKFEPNEPITREQMVTMLWNFNGKPESSVKLDNFTDGNLVSSWALQAMQWAAENCVISGKEHNNLDPKGTATRAEAACILVNYCGSGF